MIVDDHMHLGGLFKDTDYFIRCLDEAGIDFVLATPYMFEDKDIPWILKRKNIPPWLAGTKIAMHLTSKVMKNKRFGKRYINIPPNAYVAEMARKYPERICGVYWVNPNLEGIKEAEQYLIRHDFVALKLHQVLYPCEFNQKNLEIFNLANEYRVPVFVHTSCKQEVKIMSKHMEKRPNLNVILAHMNYFEEMAEEITQFPNIHLDISPLYAQKDSKILAAIEKAGADRVIFGTDSPCPGTQKYAVERVKRLDIAEEDKNKILGENIIKLINQRVTLQDRKSC